MDAIAQPSLSLHPGDKGQSFCPIVVFANLVVDPEMQKSPTGGDFGWCSGGEDGSRTRLDGFAGRCITALLPRQ
jgi:hypothetical protein